MRNRTLLAAFVVAALCAPSSLADTIVGSRHDLRAVDGGTPTGNGLNEVCVVCHTPHQAETANAQIPLWNHTGTAWTAFGAYYSPTMNALPLNIGGESMGSQSVSMLCMSCHDGTVSVLSMYNPPNSGTPTITAVPSRIADTGRIISNSNMGTSLTDDHPVNFTYDTALAGLDHGLVDPASDPAVQALLIGGTVQCSSCHDAHDPAFVPFLVRSNVGSVLCLTCHTK